MNFNENDLELTIIDNFLKKGYDYANNTDPWFSERKLNEFVNTDLLLSQLRVLNSGVKEPLLQAAIKEIINIFIFNDFI